MPKDQLHTCGVDRNVFNVFNVSVAFVWIFAASNTVQMLAAVLLGDLGTWLCAVSYTAFMAGGFVAPAITRRLGPRKGMFFGASFYLLYVASLIYMITPVLFITAVGIGFGGAVLWNSQGMLMTQSTNDKNKAKLNSLFWGTFNLSVIPGQIAGHFILGKSHHPHPQHNGSNGSLHHNTTTTITTTTAAPDPLHHMVTGWDGLNSELFLALTVAAAIGLTTILFIKPSDPSTGTKAEIETRPVWTQVKSTMGLVKDERILCILPLFTFNGVWMTMATSWFTRQMAKESVGFVMCCFGAAEFAGGFTIGRFVDSYGRGPGAALAAAFCTAALVCTWIGSGNLIDYCEKHAPHETMPCESFQDYGIFYLAAALYGFGDCTVTTVTATICTTSFAATGQTADAWALFRSFLGFGALICFSVSPMLGINGGTTSTQSQLAVELLITGGVGLLAIFGHWMFSNFTSLSEVRSEEVTLFCTQDGTSAQGIIVSGKTIYVSGCTGHVGGGEANAIAKTINSADGDQRQQQQQHQRLLLAGPGLATEAQAACNNVKAILRKAGCSVDTVVKLTVYTAVAGNSAAGGGEGGGEEDAMRVVSEVCAQNFAPKGAFMIPTVTMLAVKELEGGAHILIDAIATL